MRAVSRWSDEDAFFTADPRRRRSADVDLGATWRRDGSNDAWRLTWLRETGELYTCRSDGHDGTCTDVAVLAVLLVEDDVDRLLDGWRDRRTDPDGLGWLAARLEALVAA